MHACGSHAWAYKMQSLIPPLDLRSPDSRNPDPGPCVVQVSMWRQLSSAIEAMHRHNLTTATLHPITVASVQLDSVDGPSSVRIAPYAREIPGEQLGYSSTGAFEELCVPPEAGPGGAVADCAAADVWRVAAVATIALTGDTLKTALDSGTQATPAMLLMAVQTLRRDASRMPAELADILEVRFTLRAAVSAFACECS